VTAPCPHCGTAHRELWCPPAPVAERSRLVRELAECEHAPEHVSQFGDASAAVLWCDRCGALDLSGSGRGFVPSALGGRATRLEQDK
jgi:hypothetical protein